MTTERSTTFKHRYLGLAALLFAPAMLGARGCDVAVVGSECGGLRGQSCDRGQFCDFAPDASCGAADQLGTCEDIPAFCTEQFDPVCGCDDVTYGNACLAHAAGVSVASEGECGGGSEGDVCGGLLGASCSAGQFCNFPPEAICGAADGTGICEPIPEACTREFNPVCGCDGLTYNNPCLARAAGQSIVSEGACEPTPPDGTVCGGLQGGGCAPGEFCNFPLEAICGAADQTGICEVIPEACTFEFNPVCGCDDQTYGNACLANAAGVSVASLGECGGGGEGTVCGGLQGGACAPGEFCNFPPEAICGAADGTGVCEAIPEACTREFNPVCGCDGVTYNNPCEARAAGQSITAEGECPPVQGGVDCGGLLGLACPDGQFCSFPADAFCGAADATGQCAPRPEVCTQQFDPVCGCDGVTYGNACSAANVGVSVASVGACETTGNACGGLQGAACAPGEFCNFPLEAICGAADQTGTCEVIPEVCTFEFNPVCGCDDQTYDNACLANAAGVSVVSTGACQ